MIINLSPVYDHSYFSEYPRITTELKNVDLFISVERFVVALLISIFNGILLSDYKEKK